MQINNQKKIFSRKTNFLAQGFGFGGSFIGTATGPLKLFFESYYYLQTINPERRALIYLTQNQL